MIGWLVGVALAHAAPPRPSTDEVIRRLHAHNRPLVAALAQAGVPPAAAAIAFVPMSMTDLESLATNGIARGGPGEFPVYPNIEAPVVARFQQDRADLRVAAWPALLRDVVVAEDAWTRGAADLVGDRARSMGRRPGVLWPVLTQFLARLREAVDPEDVDTFSPDFAHLLEAAAGTTGLGVEAPARCATLLTPRVQELINAGPEPRAIVARARLREIAALLDLPWDDVTAPESPARRALVGMFARLPTRAGFVVTLGGPAFNRVRWSKRETPKIYAVDLPFVTGIVALGPREAARLRSLGDLVAGNGPGR